MQILLNPLFLKHLLYHIDRNELLQARRLFQFTTNYSPVKVPLLTIDRIIAAITNLKGTVKTAECGYVAIQY